ncbi:hypothetical protein VN12_04410 [Pirellula sp. SH-Sr6A]|uniref:phage portal protein family protein n=1 Tax=Pirellula sp. SH-Sr6A TaxID=1632865 RepID=UPI00078DDE9B|nr:hypothetical protein [Pirellula sp. SH-Sr6A]AMV31336.1 hypothetical protein VN12_04410 [Pirellula sp. SH-Sr6A]
MTTIEFQTQTFVGANQPTNVTFEPPTEKKRTTKAHTGTYVPTVYFRNFRDLPPFDFRAVQAMLQDPEVRLCLAMRAAPVQSVEFAYKDGKDENGQPVWKPGVKARNPIVGEWVNRQLQAIWNNYLPGVLSSQVWGWSGGEVILKLTDANLIEIDQLLPRHPQDCRLMEIKSTGKPWGVRINGVQGGGAIPVPFPYSYFVRFRPENGEKYSYSILLGAFSPWADKWLRGGALDTRRLYMHKDAYGGMKVFYPNEGIPLDDGRIIPARDIALQLAEQRMSGGVITAPSEMDDQGNPKWRIEDATVASNPAHILQYPKDLDQEIRKGMEIPDGAISNDGSGAWEGKSIPLSAFYAGLDSWVTQILADLRRTLDPIAELNWGCVPEYEICHKPLALQAMEMQGAKRKDAQPGYGMQIPSFDPIQAVGRGVLDAGSMVRAARMAIKVRKKKDSPTIPCETVESK